jgi:predicted ATPase/class 3 adenylate cyclase
MPADTTERLPSGLVTFVYTDIEGSTRLFRRIGDAYVAIQDRHDEILHSVWDRNDGYFVSSEGDQHIAAFSDPARAIAACADAHRSLAAEPWPDGISLRVRAGVHAGLASPRGGDYVALALHQAARVISAAHGGQTLVSEQAADGTILDDGLTLRPMGRFRLRDFTEPVRLYQVVGDGLGEEFPAIRAIPADGHNIVKPDTEIIGRDQDIVELRSLVAAGRTVTLIGPGGVGKSRLVSEVGISIAPDWDDGVWFVDLSSVAEADLVPGAVATAIGAPAETGGARTDDVLRHLETRAAVVILDNCEHVAAAARSLIGAVLDACEEVGILTTSREPLHAAAERLWPVESLATVADIAPTAGDVIASPAGRLFLDRATAVRPRFVIDDSNAAVVAEISRHLDGVPLLIELAAAHVAHQSPQEILAGLEGQIRTLRSGDPRRSDRHRNVEGLLDWSYRLLETTEAAALRRLSVFSDSFSRESAAVAIADDELHLDDAVDLVWSLVDRSLLAADVADNATRYRLLETVRTYARHHLEEAEEVEDVAQRLAAWYLQRLGPWMPQDRAWLDEVDVEIDNLRSLIPLVAAVDAESAQQLACSIGGHHDAIQNFDEGIEELRRLSAMLDRPSASRVSLLTTLAFLLTRTGRLDDAEELLGEANRLRAEHGAPDWDDVGIERVEGDIARRSGDMDRAVSIAQEALDRPLSERGRARMYNLLGMSAAALGDLELADEACRRELELNEALGRDAHVATAHGNLAEVAMRRGDIETAARHQRACLDLAAAQGSKAMIGFSLIVAARIASGADDWEAATELQCRAEELLDEIGLALYPDDQTQSDELMAAALQHLGEGPFESARAEGRRMDVPTAVEAADAILASASGAAE